ncbi:LPS-assembly protein LptD [Brachymonas sp.]|uniref:LPS-assembly protein LptD n=1 Tax=Brachymonas sp. TaxID=1936292 RepID=UPI0035B491AE
MIQNSSPLRRRSRTDEMPPRLHPQATALAAWLLCAGCLAPSSAGAGTAAAPAPAASRAEAASAPLSLQPSPWLDERLPVREPGTASPGATTVVDADRLHGQVDRSVTATGQAVLRQPGGVVHGDTLVYDQSANTVTATGHVRINRQGNVYRGDRLQLQLDTMSGGFSDVQYGLLRNGAHGTASQVDFIDDTHSLAHDAIYTTCRTDDARAGKSNPAWYFRGDKILIDTERDEGYVQHGALVFKGVPILPIPGGLGFPLSDKRRSGLLAPSMSYGSNDGLTYSQPYYFDIAPNRDATVTPTIYSSRGVNLYGQFRYLEPHYSGNIEVNDMPHDNLRDIKRWSYRLNHTQTIPTGTSLGGDLGLTLNLHRVSDDNYWRDFNSLSAINSSLSDRLLSNDVRLNWSHGDWSAYVFAQKWQTLQQPDTLTPPFDKLPQAHATYSRTDVRGFDYSIDLDTTRFRSDSTLTGYPNGQRSYVQGRVSYPWLSSWGHLTPTLQLDATRYDTSTPMSNGATSATRVLPTFTLDGGLVFERSTQFFGRNITQTLEPRLFYAYTPYRDQSYLPVYDTALKDFNLSSIFSANPFSGNDRVADINALTAGVTSRLYEADTGKELASFTAAARRQMHARQVTLNASDTADSSSFSDLLFDASLHWSPRWSTRAALQYDPTIGRNIRSVFGVSYSPGPYRTLSANYRLQRGVSEQVDAGWQWPINDLWGEKDASPGRGQGLGPNRWYSVGRVYYSMLDRRIVDAILGFEYDSCCWIGRVALRRQQTQETPVQYSNKIMFQLELTGLTRLGSSPIPTFRDNIPHYQLLRDGSAAEHSRFEQYE